MLAFQLLEDDRAKLGILRVRQVRLDRRMPGQEPMGSARMLAPFVVQAAQNRVLVGALREARQQFADVDAGDVGTDGTKVAANLTRGVRLEVEGFEMARSAVGPEEDDAEIAIRMLAGEELRERGRASAECA
jgi:hypothetical protein